MNVRKQSWLAGLSALILIVLLAACGDNATPTPATGNLPASNVTNPAPTVTTASSATTQAVAPNPITPATNVNNPAPVVPPTVAGAQASPVPTAPPPTAAVLPTPAIPTPVFINPPANNPAQTTRGNQTGTNPATSPASTAADPTTAPATTATAQNGGVNSSQSGVGNPNGSNNPVAYPNATALPVTANLLQQYNQLITPTLVNPQIQAFVTGDGLANVTGFYNTQLTRLGYTPQIPQTINRQQFSLSGQILNFSCGATTGNNTSNNGTTNGNTGNATNGGIGSAGGSTNSGTNGNTTTGNGQTNGASSSSPAGCGGSSSNQQNGPGSSAGSSNTASLVRIVALGPLDQPTINLLTSQFPGLPVTLPVNGTLIMVFTSNNQA